MRVFGLSKKACSFIFLAFFLACGSDKYAKKADDAITKINPAMLGKSVAVKGSERWLLTQFFGKTMDVKKLQFTFKSVWSIGSTRTIQNIINFDKKHNISDPKYRRSPKFLILFAHEGTHVWQYQNVGLGYIPDSLYNQSKGSILHKSRGRAYQYTLKKSKRFNQYGSEQQAKIIEEYFALKIFKQKPWRCLNFKSLKRKRFIKLVETIIKRDVNPEFKGLNAKKTRRILLKSK